MRVEWFGENAWAWLIPTCDIITLWRKSGADCLATKRGTIKLVPNKGFQVTSSIISTPDVGPTGIAAGVEARIGVAAIVFCGESVLVGVRGVGTLGSGILCFPGGHFEPAKDKSVPHCAVREVEEETGIEIEVYSPDGVRFDLFSTYNVFEGIPYVTHFVLGRYKRGGELMGAGVHGLIGSCVASVEPDKCPFWQWYPLAHLRQIRNDPCISWLPLDKIAKYNIKSEYDLIGRDPRKIDL